MNLNTVIYCQVAGTLNNRTKKVSKEKYGETGERLTSVVYIVPPPLAFVCITVIYQEQVMHNQYIKFTFYRI